MIHRTSRETEQEYRQHHAISQSKLKLILSGVGVYNNTHVDEDDIYYSEKAHFIVGSAVDTLITMDEDTFREEYCISTMHSKPSGTIMSIIREAFDFQWAATHGKLTYEHFTSDRLKTSIMLAVDSHEWQKNWKTETKYNKIISNDLHQEYWDELINAGGRQILSNEQYVLISNIYENLIDGEYTSSYFEDADHLEIFYQLPLYFIYNDVECKGLLDLCIVNHRDKTILPVDIKTMGDYTINFPKSFFKRRYDFQAAFYTQAIYNSNFNQWGYEVLPFKFIVESTISPGNPLVYTCTQEVLLKRGKYGLPARRIGEHILREVKGFHQAIELYKWHSLNGWEKDRIVQEREGNLLLGLEGIVE